jgi:hypothetical protein
MTDPPPYPDSNADTGVGPGRESTTGAPRWVKVFGAIGLVVVLLVVILLLAGGGNHGPGRHTGGQTPPSSVTAPDGAGGPAPSSSVTGSGGVGGHTPPAGGHAP